MTHLAVSPLAVSSLPDHFTTASSPDEMSMLDALDDERKAGSPDHVKHEGVHHDDDASATSHALEVLASLERETAGYEHQPLDHASGSASGSPCARSGTKTKMTVEEKKRRNRDCMRRLRNRRNDLIATMRIEIQELETQLDRQLDISQNGNRHTESGAHPENPQHPEKSDTRRRALETLDSDHLRIKTAMRRLREENYWLQKQLEQRHEHLGPLRKAVDDRDKADPPIDPEVLEREEMGDWIRNTDRFFPPLEESRAYEIVMESYRIIQDGVILAQKIQSSPNAVLGWSDQRSVDKGWANFMMRKTFPHEQARVLALKTWQLMSRAAEINNLQPKAHEMKVIQQLNEFTLVVARRSYFEHAQLSYCMIYLLFLLETDTGFVVGSRSLEPDEARMAQFTTERMVVAKPFHCFHLQTDPATGGCTLTFAGRVDNVVPEYARDCAMDLLMAAMRWENYCVSPLWRLAT